MYGQELILDLHDCVAEENLTKVHRVYEFCICLCSLIDMQREDFHVWANDDLTQGDPKTTGISAVQFILTSSIVLHCLPLLNQVHLNVFSCKEFNPEVVENYVLDWFDGIIVNKVEVDRH